MRTQKSPTKSAEDVRIGATIRQLREMRGYTLDQLANEVSATIPMSRSYLNNLELAQRKLQERYLIPLADALLVKPVVIVKDGYFDQDAADEVKAAQARIRMAEQALALCDQARKEIDEITTDALAALAAARKEVAA